ncbi:MAG TPA: hypothetical protein GX688_07340 [Clostridiales bacterium]|nr:hypothetical protein [Clostridiales bacterium]
MKRIIALIVVSMLALTSCGAKGGPAGGAEGDLSALRAQIQEAQQAFSRLGTGELRIETERTQTYVHASGGQDVEQEETTSDIIYFKKTGSDYEFIQIRRQSLADTPEGFKQHNDIHTKFYYISRPNGTHTWQEAAAESGYDSLPEEADWLFRLESEPLIEAIEADEQDGYTVYELTPNEAWFEAAAAGSEYNGYAVDAYSISYSINEDGLLRSVRVAQDESWIHSDMYDIRQTLRCEIELVDTGTAPDMDYFKNDSTYQKPVYDEITEIWREEFINLPETFLFDVRIPRMKSDLPGAAAINSRIQEDCNLELTATAVDLESYGSWGGYPWHTVDFAVMKFGHVYQICIFNTEASAWGSGVNRWLYKYYYDSVAGEAMSADDFLVHMGYEPPEIEELFFRDVVIEDIDSADDYSYDDIADWYYFDENGRVQFYVTLYG